MSGLKPLLASYGGGHVKIIAPLIKAFIERGDRPRALGFTTAQYIPRLTNNWVTGVFNLKALSAMV